MFATLFGLIICSSIAVMVAGLLSYLRNPEKLQNRLFLALSLKVGLWAIFNFLGSNIVDPTLTQVFVYLDFIFALLLGWSLLSFVVVTTWQLEGMKMSRVLLSRRFVVGAGIFNTLLIVGLASGAMIDVSVAMSELEVHMSPLFFLYLVPLVGYLLGACILLVRGYRVARHAERQQLGLMVLGLVVTVIANLLSNLVFPELFAERSTVVALNLVGYLGLFFFVLCIYLAITMRQLFDIRLVLARSVTYVTLVGLIAAFYAAVLILIGYLFLGGQDLNTRTLATNIAVTFVVAVTFPFLRKALSRVTDRIFFRGAYDAEMFVDQMNAIATANLDINRLLRQSTLLFHDMLKSAHCVFLIFEEKDGIKHVIGEQKASLDYRSLAEELRPALYARRCFTKDELEDSKLKSKLQRAASDVIMPLYANNVLVGCGLLDIKQDGAAYTRQDMRVLDVAAASLSIAVQNALRFEEIQNFNVTLQEQIERATHKLQKTNEKLRALDETKDDFISMASHQLRTPLTSVKGYLSMVIEGDAGKITSKQEKLLNQAFVSSQRMVYLIADLLNVSRLRTGKFVIESTATNLADVIEGEVDQLVEVAEGRELKLAYTKPKDFPSLMLDETKIRQVLMNFIDNAIYYTPAGGHIEVKLEETADSITLKVVDDGIGVPRHEQHHLFTKFFRANNAKKARPDGTGLGLFMAKKVIIAQGGSIVFRSREGHGSTFGFTFGKAKLQLSARSVNSPSQQAGTTDNEKMN
ncbi:MAG TPA: ATP-binding protein [Verrucomicrobiae bacterium]|nr:ATP-binding protein [Verrucomicrobiae bacterium]